MTCCSNCAKIRCEGRFQNAGFPHRNLRQKDPLAEKIDPEGVNVVIMSLLHNDVDIRAIMYLKLLGMNEPQEANIDFPINTYNAIQQTVTSDGNTVH